MNKAVVSKIGLFSGLALFCMVFFLDEIPGLSKSGQITLCVFLLMGIWWATEALPLPITSLLPLVLFPLFGVAEIGVISKEFMNKVQFLFAGGFMIAIAMQKWNLHRRVALTILQYSTLSGKKNRSVIHGNQCVIKYVGDEYIYHNYASSNCCICMLCNL